MEVPQAQAQQAEETTLLLGIQEDQHLNERAREAAESRLLQMGQMVLRPELTAADQRCQELDCLTRLARRHGASRVLAGEIHRRQLSARVKVWLFEIKTEDLNVKEDVCNGCTSDDVEALVKQLAGALCELAPPLPEHTWDPVALCRPTRTLGRGIAAGAGAALLLSGLVVGSELRAHDGQKITGPGVPDNIMADYKGLSPAAFSLAAAGGVGLALAALLPERQGCKSWFGDRTTWPSFGRGVAVGALTNLAVMSLGMLLSVGALQHRQPEPGLLPLEMAGEMRFAGAATATFVVGLGVTLALLPEIRNK